MQSPSSSSRFVTVLILGALTAVSPFSIDMYLPAFPKVAADLNTTVPEVALTLTSYFVGLAAGQLFYGPVMDRFGRKRPLYFGLIVYILAAIACGLSPSIQSLIAFRFVQAIGGCGAGVAAFAMVRDLFSPRESAKVLSTLVLILGASPLFAPTIGSLLSVALGWSSLFYTLAIGGALLFLVVLFFLPESRGPDPDHPLHPIAIGKGYLSIFKHPSFYIYTMAGSIGFSGLFIYLAASPTIFMRIFGVKENVYAYIFASIAAGFVFTSQMNVLLLKRMRSETVLLAAIASLAFVSAVFALSSYLGFYSVWSVVGLLFLILSCVGLANPNATALAMAPFGAQAGSAAALVGFVQMAIGAFASFIVGLLKVENLAAIAAVFMGTSLISLLILVFGKNRVPATLTSGMNSDS